MELPQMFFEYEIVVFGISLTPGGENYTLIVHVRLSCVTQLRSILPPRILRWPYSSILDFETYINVPKAQMVCD